MNELIFLIEDAPEGGFTAKALGECIYTEGDTLDDLKTQIKDAVICHFEDESKRPKILRLHYVKEEILSLAS